MFNPNQIGNDNGEMDQDGIMPEPFDYLEHAKKLREEREAIEATRKAEREAKELEKKAEKAERVAKKMADKANDDLEKKADKIAEKTGEAKELITEARDEVAVLREQLYESADAKLPTPIETVVMSDGSEISSELEKGEQMIMEIQHSTDKLVETVTLADEVTAQAEALARARAALDSVDAEAIGISYSGQEDNSQVFGESGPQEDIRDRLRHAWELPLVNPNTEQDLVPIDQSITPAVGFDISGPDLISTANNLEDQAEYSESPSLYGGGEAVTRSTEQYTAYEQPPVQAKEDITDPIAKVSSGVKTGLAFAAGLFAGKSHSTKKTLETTESSLRSQTAELSREIQSAAAQPLTTYEVPTAPALASYTEGALPRPEVRLSGTRELSTAKAEIRGTNEPAIPEWIKQIEKDVQKGRVAELKKWQIDVLRTQHPDLLKRYEKLDHMHEQQIKTQSIETIRSEPQFDRRPFTVSAPGDLPSPVFDASMPAFMRPKTPNTQPIMSMPATSTPAYEYAMRETSTGPIFGDSYVTNVMIGGLLLGALLIGFFGF